MAMLSMVLLHYGYLLFVPTVFVLARLARRRSPKLAAAGLVLGVLGSGLSGLLVTDAYDLSIAQHLPLLRPWRSRTASRRRHARDRAPLAPSGPSSGWSSCSPPCGGPAGSLRPAVLMLPAGSSGSALTPSPGPASGAPGRSRLRDGRVRVLRMSDQEFATGERA